MIAVAHPLALILLGIAPVLGSVLLIYMDDGFFDALGWAILSLYLLLGFIGAIAWAVG